MAEKFPSYSAFNYVLNNPIRYNDPSGFEGEDPIQRDNYFINFNIDLIIGSYASTDKFFGSKADIDISIDEESLLIINFGISTQRGFYMDADIHNSDDAKMGISGGNIIGAGITHSYDADDKTTTTEVDMNAGAFNQKVSIQKAVGKKDKITNSTYLSFGDKKAYGAG